MISVFTDFNASTNDDVCWNLKYNGLDLNNQISDLQLKAGDKVQLYQDENDFVVMASLDFRYVEALGRSAWVAVPDWSTLTRR